MRCGVCDFCLAEKAPWTHYTDRFVLPADYRTGLPAYADMDGEWGACVLCHSLIVEGKVAELMAQLPMKSGDDLAHHWHKRLVNAFWDNRTGTYKWD